MLGLPSMSHRAVILSLLLAGCAGTARDTSHASADSGVPRIGLLGEWRRPGTLSWLRTELSTTHRVDALDRARTLPADTELLIVARPQDLTVTSWPLIEDAVDSGVPLLLLLDAERWARDAGDWRLDTLRPWLRAQGIEWTPSVLTSDEPAWEGADESFVQATVPTPTPAVVEGLGPVAMRTPTSFAFMPDATALRSEPWLVIDTPVTRDPVGPLPVAVEDEEDWVEEEIPEEPYDEELDDIVQPEDVPDKIPGGVRSSIGYVPPANVGAPGGAPPSDVVVAGCQYRRDDDGRPLMCVVGDLSAFAPSLLWAAAKAGQTGPSGHGIANVDLLHRLIRHLTGPASRDPS